MMLNSQQNIMKKKDLIIKTLGALILVLSIFYAKDIAMFIVDIIGLSSITLLFWFPLMCTLGIAAIIGGEE